MDSSPQDSFASDPFVNAFGTSISGGGKADPFDPFGDGGRNMRPKTPADDSAGKDPFGCDPFAILHAPTRDSVSSGPPPRPESPSPALPPKKSKQPPPRPAPPRPLQPPTPSPTPAAADPFGAPSNDPFANSDGFADFSNFNSKCCHSSMSTEPISCQISLSQTEENVQLVLNIPRQSWASFLAQFSDTPGSSLRAPPPVPKLDFTEDPFRDYRYEDPFNIADPFDDVDSTLAPSTTTAFGTSGELDPFAPFSKPLPPTASGKNTPVNGKLTPTFGKNAPVKGKNTPSPLPSEDQQLAWAAAESLRLEEERRKQAEREKKDLELALALSKKDKKGVSPFYKILKS